MRRGSHQGPGNCSSRSLRSQNTCYSEFWPCVVQKTQCGLYSSRFTIVTGATCARCIICIIVTVYLLPTGHLVTYIQLLPCPLPLLLCVSFYRRGSHQMASVLCLNHTANRAKIRTQACLPVSTSLLLYSGQTPEGTSLPFPARPSFLGVSFTYSAACPSL